MVANNNRNTSSKSYRFTVFQEIEHGQSTVRPVDPPRRDDIERVGRRPVGRSKELSERNGVRGTCESYTRFPARIQNARSRRAYARKHLSLRVRSERLR